MNKIAILLIVLSLAVVTVGHEKGSLDTQTPKGGKSETEVRQRLEQWVDALKRNDVVLLDQILAEDFQYILDDGKTRSKAEEMAPNKAGDIKFEMISIDEVKVFVYGNTAIATGLGAFKGTFKGRPFESRERFCDVYQKRKGQWQVIASRPVTVR